MSWHVSWTNLLCPPNLAYPQNGAVSARLPGWPLLNQAPPARHLTWDGQHNQHNISLGSSWTSNRQKTKPQLVLTCKMIRPCDVWFLWKRRCSPNYENWNANNKWLVNRIVSFNCSSTHVLNPGLSGPHPLATIKTKHCAVQSQSWLAMIVVVQTNPTNKVHKIRDHILTETILDSNDDNVVLFYQSVTICHNVERISFWLQLVSMCLSVWPHDLTSVSSQYQVR